MSRSWWRTLLFKAQKKAILVVGNTAWEGLKKPMCLVYKPAKTKFRGDEFYSLMMLAVLDILEPGDILLRRDDKYLMSKRWAIPGDFKHAGLYLGKDAEGIPRFIHASGNGVDTGNFCDFLMTDHITVVRPSGLTKEERQHAVDEILPFVGTGYDFDFRYNDDESLYCTELVGRAYHDFKDKFKFELNKEKRFLVERKVLLADDIFKSDVDVIFVSEEAKGWKMCKEKLDDSNSPQNPSE